MEIEASYTKWPTLQRETTVYLLPTQSISIAMHFILAHRNNQITLLARAATGTLNYPGVWLHKGINHW